MSQSQRIDARASATAEAAVQPVQASHRSASFGPAALLRCCGLGRKHGAVGAIVPASPGTEGGRVEVELQALESGSNTEPPARYVTRFLEHQRAHALQTGKVLDIGTGDERAPRAFREAGWNDVHELRRTDAELPSGLDVVHANNLLSYSQDPLHMLQRFSAATRPRGYLIGAAFSPGHSALGPRLFSRAEIELLLLKADYEHIQIGEVRRENITDRSGNPVRHWHLHPFCARRLDPTAMSAARLTKDLRTPTPGLKWFLDEHYEKAQVKSTGIAIDAGCGGGRDTRTLVELGFHVEAVDLDPYIRVALEDVIAGNFVTPHVRELQHADIDLGSADIVNVQRLLPFLGDKLQSTLVRARDLMGPGALLVASFFGPHLAPHEELFQGRKGVLAFHTEDQASELIKEVGFEIVDTFERHALNEPIAEGRLLPVMHEVYVVAKRPAPAAAT